MECSERFRECLVCRLSLSMIEFGQLRFEEDPARNVIHQIEGGPDNRRVRAEKPHWNHGHRRSAQSCLNAILAVDRMGTLQKFSRRQLAKHVVALWGADEKGWVGLPALKLLNLWGRGKIFEVIVQIMPEPRFI